MLLRQSLLFFPLLIGVAACAPAASPPQTAAAPSSQQNTASMPLDPSASCERCAALLAEVRKGVAQKSATEVDVDRGALATMLDHEPELMSHSRIVPEQEKGKVLGLRLFGASSDTLLGVLGIEDGDRLETVNGVDMTTPSNALQVYKGLRNAERVVVTLNRRGQPMSIAYTVR
jgi:general secretion pathway protein C